MKLSRRVPFLLLLAMVSTGLAQYTLDWVSVNSGGAPANYSGHSLNLSVGQAVQGSGTSANYAVDLGLWYVLTGGPAPTEPGWRRQADVPLGHRKKNVKDGGALAYGTDANDAGYVYAFKGNGTCEFYRYNTAANTWVTPDSIQAIGRAGRKKAVKKGAALIVGTNGKVYGTKGNNTLEFWCYDPAKPAGSTWTQLTDVPAGSKALKEGTGLAAVSVSGTDYIYVLKGSGTYEFYRYRISDGSWATMATAPTGLSNRPYKYGSGLAYDGGDTIYCLKGSYNELAAYSISGNNWVTKDTMPRKAPPGARKTKVKDGAGLACCGTSVYALKGGGTDEFWMFSCTDQKWHVQDQLTAGTKKVKGGGALTYAASMNALYALRGNNTVEFWMYPLLSADGLRLTASGEPKSVQGQSAVRTPQFALRVTPNPFSQSLNSSISYSLPVAGNVSLELFDISGKLVRTLVSGGHPAGSYAYHLSPAACRLSAGVYLLKLDSGGCRITQKLIIE